MKRVVPHLVLGMLLIAGAASAQVVTGTIIGAVKDESQAALPGVSATLTSPALLGGPVTSVTSNTGDYRFAALPPGVYTLVLSLPGFATYQEEGLRVTVNGTLERNVTLKVSSLAETVTVSGESPMVDVRQVAVSHTVTRELIENVQTQRYSTQDYAKWVPGVAAGDPSGRSQAVFVMGSPGSENSWLLDGITTNSPKSGQFKSSGDVDALEEMQVSTLGASAEYAIAQGAVFNAVSKSGTNTFSGSGSATLQTDRFVSKPTRVACNCLAGNTGFKRTENRDYSMHLGGPILRDRLWFFAGGIVWSRKESAPGIDPIFAGLDKDNKFNTKVTWKIGDRFNLSTFFNVEPWNSAARATIVLPLSTLTETHGNTHTYGSELAGQLSHDTLLTVRLGGTYEPDTFADPTTRNYVTPRHLDSQSGIATGGVAQFGFQRIWRRTQTFKVNHFVQSASLDQDLRGGVQLDQGRSSDQTSYPSGVQYLDVAGVPDQANYRSPWVAGAQYGWQSAWGEDQLAIRSRLTLNLGLRWDRMRAVSQDLSAVDTLLKPTSATVKGLGNLFTWNVVSPRLGFNLKLTNDDKMIVRGNYGRAYRAVLLQDFADIHPGNTPITLKRYDPATSGYTTTVSVTDPLANLALDRNIQAPFTDQYSIGLDRQVAKDLSASVSYVYKHGQKQVGWKDTGGIYGTQNVVLANGQTFTVFPLLNNPSARMFVRTNGPGFYNTYKGLLLSLTKRLSNYWQANVSYTRSSSTGLMPTGTVGQDPNDYINLAGPVAILDRPNMLQSQSTLQIPRIDVLVSANVMIVSGLPYAPQALVQLPQGRRAINIAPPGGVNRAPRQDIMALRFSKILARHGGRKLELMANVNNVLQSKAYQTFITLTYNSPQFAQPSNWIEPRNMNLMAKITF